MNYINCVVIKIQCAWQYSKANVYAFFSSNCSEGELEEEWLKEAGLSNLFGESSGDSLESMVFLSTLTRTQKAAVEKRVETVTQTMRKKNKQHQIPDVRDIFRLQNDSKGKVSSCRLFCLILAERREGHAQLRGEQGGT